MSKSLEQPKPQPQRQEIRYTPRVVIGVSSYVLMDARFHAQLQDLGRRPWYFGEVLDSKKPIDVCILGGHLVPTKDGYKDISKVVSNDFVISHDGLWHRVTETMTNYFSGDAYTVTPTCLATPVTATPNHPFYTVKRKDVKVRYKGSMEKVCLACQKPFVTIDKNGKYCSRKCYWLNVKDSSKRAPPPPIAVNRSVIQAKDVESSVVPTWVRADELEVGDYLLYPIPKNVDDVVSLRILDYLTLGHVVCEDEKLYFISTAKNGRHFIHKGHNVIDNTVNLDNDLLRLIGYYIAEGSANYGGISFCFNIKEQEYVNDVCKVIQDRFHLRCNVRTREKNSTITVEANSLILSNLFKNLFGEDSYNKHMPMFFLDLPLEKQRALITGMWRGDGCREINRHGYAYATYTTKSQVLAYQLSNLLLRQEVVFSICKSNSGTYTVNAMGLNAIKVARMIGEPIQEVKKRSNTWQQAFIKDGYFWTPIRDISTVSYEGLIYNMEVEGSNSFLCELVNVHNSRNDIVTKFLIDMPQATHLLFLDTDVILIQPDAIEQLLALGQPFVSALIVQKMPPFYPLMNLRVSPNTYRFAIRWLENQVIAVDAVGCGCMLIRRDVLQKFGPPWFLFDKQSEDYRFCEWAQAAGIPILVHTGIKVGHLGDKVYTVDDFKVFQQDEIQRSESMGVSVRR